MLTSERAVNLAIYNKLLHPKNLFSPVLWELSGSLLGYPD